MSNETLNSTYLNILEMMYLIRGVEEMIAERYSEGKMRCPMHLSIGQECPPAVLSVLLSQKYDQAVSTHRAHAHYLAKGGDPKKLIAEIYGKATGCSKGYGGSMHLIDESVGFMGSTAIVGGTIPVGVGLALAKTIKKQEGIVVIYLGDGAVEEGSFYESANFAAVKSLPVVFVCENNLYSVYSSIHERQPTDRKIYELASSIGLESSVADGNDTVESLSVLSAAVIRARSGLGPAFVELNTYRWREHCGPNFDNHIGYRSEEEFEAWKVKDPILNLEQLVRQTGVTQNKLLELKADIKERVSLYFEYAESSPFPNPALASELIYA